MRAVEYRQVWPSDHGLFNRYLVGQLVSQKDDKYGGGLAILGFAFEVTSDLPLLHLIDFT